MQLGMYSGSLPGFDVLSEIGALDYNDELLALPGQIPLNLFLKSESEKDNDLPMLSVFARALFYSSKENKDCQYVRDGLRATYVAADGLSSLRRPESERATHYINKNSGDRDFCLRFDSEACLLWAGDPEDPEYNVLFSLLDIVDDLKRLERVDMRSLLALARSRAEESLNERLHGKTMAYVVDDGEFVCSIEHRLVSINGISLRRCPIICDSVDEVEIQNAPPGFTAPESRWSSFSWLDLLDDVEKDLLGLSASQANADIIGNQDNCWKFLAASDLDESYQSSGLVSSSRNELGKLSILFGAGAEWDPEYGFSDQAEASALHEYPKAIPPTFCLELREGEPLSAEEEAYMDALSMLLDSL